MALNQTYFKKPVSVVRSLFLEHFPGAAYLKLYFWKRIMILIYQLWANIFIVVLLTNVVLTCGEMYSDVLKKEFQWSGFET